MDESGVTGDVGGLAGLGVRETVTAIGDGATTAKAVVDAALARIAATDRDARRRG